MSSLERKRIRGLARSRYRSIGDAASAAAAQAAAVFDPAQYVPQQYLDDASAGAAYYDTFQKVASFAQGVSIVHGAVQVSDADMGAASSAIAAGVAAVFPPAGVALAILNAVAPHAAAGPGVCVTDPPAGPLLSQLVAWPHFQSWESEYGAYGPNKAGTFNAYANPILEYNWLLANNCFVSRSMPPQNLLARLIVSWNATHAGPPIAVGRQFAHIGTFGVNPGYDPIADALYWAIVDVPGGYHGPDSTSKGFYVNSGPLLAAPVTVKPLVFHNLPTTTTTAAKAPAPATASTTSSTGATVAVVGIGAVAAFAAWKAGLFAKLF